MHILLHFPLVLKNSLGFFILLRREIFTPLLEDVDTTARDDQNVQARKAVVVLVYTVFVFNAGQVLYNTLVSELVGSSIVALLLLHGIL
jgi:hypothetical protein